MKQAIAKRDAAAIAKAVKTVNDSKAAKAKADAEAKAKAEQEAAKRKAEEESAAEPQQSQNVQRQTAGTGQGRAQRQESVQTPSTTQRQQQPSTPSGPSVRGPSDRRPRMAGGGAWGSGVHHNPHEREGPVRGRGTRPAGQRRPASPEPGRAVRHVHGTRPRSAPRAAFIRGLDLDGFPETYPRAYARMLADLEAGGKA